ncbi:IS110 family transposase [filamentous cyanobacterium CCP1]|nr:IS110 family transposase [filamentous cyanobacterium CCP2]PSB65248.1 IS110 family transposase [filamentous cyanobacterium CCP1]
MPPCTLGLDISKVNIHAALLIEGRSPRGKVVSNDAKGHLALLEWLRASQARAVALLPGSDQSLWAPPSPELEQLQQLERRLQALEQMIAQEKNRLESAAPCLHADIEAHIEFMQQQHSQLRQQLQDHIDQHPDLQQQQHLLDSIPGIGKDSAARILGELGHWQAFGSARQLAAYAGITPQEKTSGSSVHGKTRLCKLGSPRLRKLLFFPALSLLRWSVPIRQWRNALLQRGKTKKQVVGAVMHKVIRWVFGVLHSQKPFDPALAFPNSPA